MKAKVKIKNNKLCVRVKVSSEELISSRELDIMNIKPVRGLLQPAQIRKNLVEYTGLAGIALSDYLKRTLTEYEFFYFMAQIVTITWKLRNHNLFLNNLILDLRYAEFLRMQNNFEPQAVEEAITKESGGLIPPNRFSQSSFLTDKPKDYYEHYDKKSSEEDSTWILNETSDSSIPEETGLLGEEETGLLEAEEQGGVSVPQRQHYASLYRTSAGEAIEINKPVFRIGKDKNSVDYFVDNTIVVSRNHADIITRGTRHFIIDQNSKNHTYTLHMYR